MFALLLSAMIAPAQVTDDPLRTDSPEIQRAKDLFVGNWRIVSLTEDGERLGPELVERKLAQGGLVRINRRLLTFENPETLDVRSLAYRIDPAKSPRQIDVISRNDRILPGIYKFEGDNLVFCIESQAGSPRPDKFEAPQGSGRLLVSMKLDAQDKPLASLDKPTTDPKPVPEPVLLPQAENELEKLSRDRSARFLPEVRRAHELLAGNWDIVSIVDDGESLGADLIRAKFAEKGRIVIGTRTASMTSPVSGERRISAIQIDPTQSPSHVNVTNQFDQVLKGIYRFDGDHLKLCVAKGEEDPRPTDFTASAGSDRMLFDLKLASANAKPAAPKEPLPVTAEVVKARPLVQSVDEQVRDRLIGSWSITDRKGNLTFVIRRDGTFTSTRKWKKAVKRVFEGGDTNSSGRWNYSRGIFSAEVTRTTDFGLAGHVIYGNIQSIGDQTMVIRSDMGELLTATKLQ